MLKPLFALPTLLLLIFSFQQPAPTPAPTPTPTPSVIPAEAARMVNPVKPTPESQTHAKKSVWV